MQPQLRQAEEGFFHHLLDVINPLQHLPVIGTIYRAITGEHIGAVEKIAGDTLYGGLWGAVVVRRRCGVRRADRQEF